MRISDWSSDVCSSDIRYGRAERFMAPKPLAAGRELIAARAFGPVCPQRDDRYAPQSEDCLFLNILTPEAVPRANRPVMLYNPRGPYSNGSGTNSDERRGRNGC